MEKIRVAVFLPADIKEKSNSGIARIEMFKYLKNIDFDIYHFGNVGPYYSEANPKNINMFVRTYRKFKKNHQRKAYDLIWATLPPILMALFASRLKQQFKIPLVVDVRDPGISSVVLKYSTNNWRFKLAKNIEKWIYLKADKICVVTPELKQFLYNKLNVPNSKIEIISNATTIKKIQKQPLKNVINIFFGGNFAPYQIVDKVLKNIAKNKKQSNNFIFNFYGYKIKEHPELQKIVERYHLENIVKLYPPIDRKKLFNNLNKTHIALVPISGLSHPELYDYAIPLKFYEALSFSKPILLYKGTKASKNAIKNHKVGLVCSDKDNIFQKLNQIKNKYNYYQLNCQKTIYLRQNEAKKLEKIINKLIKK